MTTFGRPAAIPDADLVIPRGADYDRFRTRWKTGSPATAVDLTGWTARAQIRDNSGVLWLTLTETTGITLGSDGLIAIHIPHTATEGTEWDVRRYGRWDLELTDPTGFRRRWAQGKVEIVPDVTRDA